MTLLQEDPDLILQRKYRNILGVCGKGILLLAAWSVIKGLMYVIMGDNLIRQINDVFGDNGVSDSFSRGVFISLFVIVVLMDLLLRLIVARMALAEAKGKRTGIFPLIIAVLLLLYSSFGVYSTFAQDDLALYYTLADRIITAFVELTSIYNLAEIIVYSVKLRKLTKPGTNTAGGKEEA